jgi:hypothetical protein
MCMTCKRQSLALTSKENKVLKLYIVYSVQRFSSAKNLEDYFIFLHLLLNQLARGDKSSKIY